MLNDAGAARKPVACVENPGSLFDLMSRADLAISGGGQALYELACVGCPAIAVEVAPDQGGQMQVLQEDGLIRAAGKAGDPGLLPKIQEDLQRLAGDPHLRSDMARKGQERVDGKGADRVAQQFIEQTEALAR